MPSAWVQRQDSYKDSAWYISGVFKKLLVKLADLRWSGIAGNKPSALSEAERFPLVQELHCLWRFFDSAEMH